MTAMMDVHLPELLSVSEEPFHSSPSKETMSSPNSDKQSSIATTPCSFTAQHAENSLHRMDGYFLRQQLTDVTIISGHRKIPAHRLVLCSASDYFAAMFTSDVVEATKSEIEIQNVDPDSMYSLIHYCYTGKVDLHEDTVENVMSTACLLCLTAVVQSCTDFLIKQLHPSNCIGISLFAESQSCDKLLTAARAYTMENFQVVIQNQEFMLLPANEVLKLLASDDLNVPSEEIVFNSLMTWTNNDLTNRKQHLASLLGYVKLPLLTPQFIADHIESDPAFEAERGCQELIFEALKYHLLPERRSLLQSHRTRPRKSTIGLMYAVGGMDANKGATNVIKYNPRKDTWDNVTKMNGRRLQFGAALIGDRLYVVGGRDGLKTLNSVECFDLKAGTWNLMPPMSTHRHGLGVGVLQGPLYAVGGHDGWSYLNTVERWDAQTRQWRFVAPMSTQRSTAGVAVLNNKLYAVGGRDGSSCLRTVECYDPHTDKWTLCAPMAKRRGGVGVGVLNGYLYALGGHDAPASNPAASRFDCVERYDPKTDTWTVVSSLSVGRDAVGVCSLGDKLYAVGGYDGQNYLSLVESYDPQANEWTQVCPLLNGRAGAPLVEVKLDPSS